MPPKSTELLLMHCDDTAYVGTSDTNLYKIVDAICGTTGAGALANQVFVARLSGAMETIFGTDLDYIFGNTNILVRAPEESYPFNPLTDTLTAAQWNEVRIKDAWYRARIRDFFNSCRLGSTIEGIRMCVQAALTTDCDVFEVWRYIDGFGITEDLGRAPFSARNELVIKPHKTSLAPGEVRLVRDMLSRFMSLDTIVTVNVQGLAVETPLPIAAAASDSTYYEVQKMVTPTPIVSQLPPPELLPIDLLPTETWMLSGDPTLAPYALFNISQEYGYYYLTGGGSRSPIDSVTYGSINTAGPVKITVFELSGTYHSIGSVPMGIPTDSYYNNLDSDFFQWIPVPYSADLYPMDQSVANGMFNLTNAINSIPGPFILVGYSQGAIVVSNIYDEIRGGALGARRADLLAGLTFGNPRRQPGVIFPGGTDPGGHGILNWDLLSGTESLWWEFAAPGDPASTTGDNQAGLDLSDLMGLLYQHYTGIFSVIVDLILHPINGAEALIQALIDLFHGVGRSGSAHGLYNSHSYHPIANDDRDCIEIGFDYINSLRLPNLAALATTFPSVNTQVTCYEVGETTTSTPNSWFASNLDSRIRYIWVPYPSTNELPLTEAIDAGVASLITMINRNAGPFLLIGTGEGAIVTSKLYDQLRVGAMQHRRVDFLAGVAFGNPRREVDVIFPGGTDPGGHGISATRLAGTESLWWEFVNPEDLLATNGDDTPGQWNATLFDSMVVNYTGDPGVITALYPSATVNTSLQLQAILNVVFNLGPLTSHTAYNSITPIVGDTRTSFEIARDYLNTFARLSTPYVIPPIDPMQTYKPEADFQSFTRVANYGPWQTYEIVDSVDNYPGGKFGKTPATAPALNPDGTPYHFPWMSQQAFITAKLNQVQALGGQADEIHYRLPVGAAAITKQDFLPSYAIAATAPTMDSTVSISLTQARPRAISQTGWNAVFATSGAAANSSSRSSG